MTPTYQQVSLSRGAFHPAGGVRAVFGSVAILAVVAVYARLLAVLRDHELRLHGKPLPWWFGYARDAVNLTGLAGLWAGFAVLGVSPPVALLLGFGYGLVVYSLDYGLAYGMGRASAPWRGARQTALAALMTMVLLAPALARPGSFAEGVARAVDVLFGVKH